MNPFVPLLVCAAIVLPIVAYCMGRSDAGFQSPDDAQERADMQAELKAAHREALRQDALKRRRTRKELERWDAKGGQAAQILLFDRWRELPREERRA